MKRKISLFLITLFFYVNASSQSSFYDYKEFRAFYIKTFKKYKDLLIEDLNSLEGISDGEITKYYDKNQNRFQCRSISFDIRLSTGKSLKSKDKIDDKLSRYTFKDGNLNIMGYKGNNLKKVRFKTSIPFTNLNIKKHNKNYSSEISISSLKEIKLTYKGKEMLGKIRIVIVLEDSQKKQIDEYYDVISSLTKKNTIDDFKHKILSIIKNNPDKGFITNYAYNSNSIYLKKPSLQSFLSTWDNILNPNFSTYFKFESGSSNEEFIQDMMILEALKLSSPLMFDSVTGAFFGGKSNRESYFKILKNTVSNFDENKIKKFKSIYPLWNFHKGKTLENINQITNINHLKKQKKLYENYGELTLFNNKIKEQLERIKDKKLVSNILFFLASSGERDYWNLLIKSNEITHFDEKQLELISTMRVLKQRTYFFLRAQYFDLLNGVWGGQQNGYVNTRKKYTLCGIRSDIMASIPYEIPNNTSRLLINYLRIEKLIGKKMLETYRNNQNLTGSAIYNFITAPSWMQYPLDDDGNIIITEEARLNNEEASDKMSGVFASFLGVIANSYSLKKLQDEYAKAQNYFREGIIRQYGQELGNQLISEFSIHCGTKEAENTYESWFMKEYINGPKTSYSNTKMEEYRKHGRHMDRYKMLLDNGQVSESEKTDFLVNSVNTGRLHKMRLFLSVGANPDRTNSYGISARMQLQKEGNGYIQSLMREIINKNK